MLVRHVFFVYLFAAIRPVGDINREVGSSYEAYCLFDPKRVNVSEVYFQHWSEVDRFKIPHEVCLVSAWL